MAKSRNSPSITRTAKALPLSSSHSRDVERILFAMLTSPLNISLNTRANAESEKARGDMNMASVIHVSLRRFRVSAAAMNVMTVLSGRKSNVNLAVFFTLAVNAESENSVM